MEKAIMWSDEQKEKSYKRVLHNKLQNAIDMITNISQLCNSTIFEKKEKRIFHIY